MQRRVTVAHAGVAAAAVIAMLGASALWIVLTPQQQWIVYPQTAELPKGQALSLPLESYYRFTSIAFFALGALVVGVVMAVAAWQIRFARGTPMVLVLVGSLAAGAALGLFVGHLVRGGVDPAVLAAQGVATPTLVQMPASISRWAIVIAPGIAAVMYALTAAWHSDPDLGRPQALARNGSDSADQPFGSPFQSPGDPITAPIPVVVGTGYHPDSLPTRQAAASSGPAVLGGPAFGPGPAVGPGPALGPGHAVGPGPTVSPAAGTPRTDPSPGTR